MSTAKPFHEAIRATPIRDLGLTLAGTELEPVIEEFEGELKRAGIEKLRPKFYLSTEWGVPFGSTAIAIPFYLARPDLKELHAEETGFVEGASRSDILRYLRHEMGHVVNYAYQLYEDENWIEHFGSMTQPYVEEYRPQPFSRRYVVHLPGWYAQKHPDEDWAETFAVWMTPERDWRAEYHDRPAALAKLEYCDQTVRDIPEREPRATSDELDEDVGELTASIEQFYHAAPPSDDGFPLGLDGALRTIFDEYGEPGSSPESVKRLPASKLIRQLRTQMAANVYRWTGHFPERTQRLVRYLAQRADELKQVYPEDREAQVSVALTTLVTALAMNYVHRGSYLP